ncbi:hypothetical protein [Salinarimonas ramus]|uniref:Uncharacterized protein n=1 Tax=Salinarimonas ramus TaxID=690164 RepID=A0A917Q5K8_9HYPH|nr:hypothetical protein [Salinarimonas ramus]GGK25872.1 hypothetical protein GCM10011322_10460 [Salinarimonas ramus]
MRATGFGLLFLAATAAIAPASAQGVPPRAEALIDDAVVAEVRSWLSTEIVRLSVTNQNERYADLDANGISALDAQWVAEREAADKPLIAATLSSPLSVYLTRIQARSLGLYAELFVTDAHGLNVGQSSITSDFWQGDEAKFQETFPKGPDAVFIDEPEWDDEMRVWRAQLNLTIADESGRTPIGAATVEINLTELMRRDGFVGG